MLDEDLRSNITDDHIVCDAGAQQEVNGAHFDKQFALGSKQMVAFETSMLVLLSNFRLATLSTNRILIVSIDLRRVSIDVLTR